MSRTCDFCDRDALKAEIEHLRSRLAKVETALQRCADYLDASATCNSDRAMASMARAVLAPDSASVTQEKNP